MIDFEWAKSGAGLIKFMNKYFGVSKEYIEKAINENFKTSYDRNKLVAIMRGLAEHCQKGKTAFDESLTDEQLNDRKKSAEAILSNPSFSEDDLIYDYNYSQTYNEEQRYYHIYERLNGLYNSISEKGIDIYKTIYITSLTDGNLGVYFDKETGRKLRSPKDDRDFDNIYNTLIQTLDFPSDQAQELANSIFEKCAATMIAKASASNIREVYEMLLKLRVFYDPERTRWNYLFRCDPKYVDNMRLEQKSRAIREGLINCPSLFACKPDKIYRAFEYVMRKILNKLIRENYEEAQRLGKTSMNMYACKYHIARSWINNNFSILTINAEKMEQKENIMKNVEYYLNHRQLVNDDFENYSKYSFGFLFDNPLSISIMNAIPIDKMTANAYENVLTLERFAGKEGMLDYIKRNQYALAMNNNKLESLLAKIVAHDRQNPDQQFKARFLKVGKSLFGNKHNIEFNVDKVINKLSNIEDITILNVDQMSDWERVQTFVELFFDNDPRIVPLIKRLSEEKIAKLNRERELLIGSEIGVSEKEMTQQKDTNVKMLRTRIRTMLAENGGWDAILKDEGKLKKLTRDIQSITDIRFSVEQVERTGEHYFDVMRLQEKENKFSSDIKDVLEKFRNAATSPKFDKLSKRFSDIDRLCAMTIDFLSNVCFDDKEPISDIIESELRTPLIETLKKQEGAYLDPQASLFGGETVIVPIPKKIYKTLKGLTDEISKDSLHKIDSNILKIEKAKDEGKK